MPSKAEKMQKALYSLKGPKRTKAPNFKKFMLEVVNVPKKGDFKWDDIEAGDWHVYDCGEDDCPVRWHRTAYATEFGRKDGKLYVATHDVDEDGNWDIVGGYEEGEPQSVWDDEWWYHLGPLTSFEFFKGWAEYDLEVFETGEDPVGEYTVKGEAALREAAEKSFWENIKYARMK